jgi:hypothetical protein
MKNSYVIIFVIAFIFVSFGAGFVTRCATEPPKPIIIPQIEYRDSPKIDSLKNIIDTLQKNLIAKKKIFYKYIPTYKTTYKDTGSFKVIHDSIIFLADDIFKAQDSIISLKDSIIIDLTNTLKLTRDSVNYYRVLYIDEKTRKKTWKWVSAASLLLNGIFILKI